MSQENVNQEPISPITWGLLGKVTLAALVSWAAYEFRGMREAVYNTQTHLAVIESKLEAHAKDMDRTNKRVDKIEAKLFEESK